MTIPGMNRGHAGAPIRILDDADSAGVPRPADVAGPDFEPEDPAALMLVCASCGAHMDERKCKLVCRCGYFLSCSDYY